MKVFHSFQNCDEYYLYSFINEGLSEDPPNSVISCKVQHEYLKNTYKFWGILENIGPAHTAQIICLVTEFKRELGICDVNN